VFTWVEGLGCRQVTNLSYFSQSHVKGQFLLAKGQAFRAVFVLETRWLPGFLNTKIHDYVP